MNFEKIKVALRYLASNSGVLLGVLAAVNILTPEQASALGVALPALLNAALAFAAVIVTFVPPIWAILKGQPIKALQVVEEIKKSADELRQIKLKTPSGQPDLLIKAVPLA